MADVVKAGLPLWHVAFLNPDMVHARNLGEDFPLFGAYSAERDEEIEDGLRSVIASSRGRVLPAAEAYRAWGKDPILSRPPTLPHHSQVCPAR